MASTEGFADETEAVLHALWAEHERTSRAIDDYEVDSPDDLDAIRVLSRERMLLRLRAMQIPASTNGQMRFKVGIIRRYLPPPTEDNPDLLAAHSILDDVDRICGGLRKLPELDSIPEHMP